MNPESNLITFIKRTYFSFPGWLKIIVVLSILSLIANGASWIILKTRMIITGKSEIQLCLSTYESEYHDFQIKIPRCWWPPWNPPHESREGIQGDPYLILQYWEGDFPQATFEIARITIQDADLEEITAWEKKRALAIPGATIDSIDFYETSRYPGTSLKYSIENAGYLHHDRECLDWVTYIEPFGYSITICTIPSDRERFKDPFLEIIESFIVK